jgi:hypothetical protein
VSAYCWSCSRRVSHGDECGRCARAFRDRIEQAEAEDDAITRRENAIAIEPRPPVLEVECTVCGRPSPYDPCDPCDDEMYGRRRRL